MDLQYILFGIGDPVSIPKSSFSLNEFWSKTEPNGDDSRRDEGYLELQWRLPMGMNLAEKFVFRFEHLSSENSTNQVHDVFKIIINTHRADDIYLLL